MANDPVLATPTARRSCWICVIVICIALVVVAAFFGPRVLGVAWKTFDSAAVKDLQARSTSMAEPSKGAALLVVAVFDEYRRITRTWSAVYNGFVFGAAALGIIATLVLKLESVTMRETRKKDVAAILASAGAVLAALSASGDFQMKWQANRSAAAEVESLAFEMLSPTPPEAETIYANLKEIADERHTKVISAKRAAERNEKVESPARRASGAASGADTAPGPRR